ncbi:MAG: hypothetical protein HY589_04315 [Candidatus Omnitrophica bacterium]|nr:hypothetical protein [Candidatus Omnitrophota bacterium]
MNIGAGAHIMGRKGHPVVIAGGAFIGSNALINQGARINSSFVLGEVPEGKILLPLTVYDSERGVEEIGGLLEEKYAGVLFRTFIYRGKLYTPPENRWAGDYFVPNIIDALAGELRGKSPRPSGPLGLIERTRRRWEMENHRFRNGRWRYIKRADVWRWEGRKGAFSKLNLDLPLMSSVLRPRAMADRLEGEKAKGGSGLGVSDPGIMPYRGHGNATECIMRTLRRCLYELRTRAEANGMKHDKEYEGFENFLQWFDSQLAAGKPLDEVPPSVTLPIRRLTNEEDDTMIQEIFIQHTLGGRLLMVVRLPVQELGRVKGEPFYTYLAFASGVIWAAGKGNKTDIELRIRHAVEEYIIILKKAREDMGQMAGRRDSGDSDAYQFFCKAHVGAWKKVAAVYNDEFEDIRNRIPFGGIQVRKAHQGEIALAEIKARRAYSFFIAAQQSIKAEVPRNLRSLLESI